MKRQRSTGHRKLSAHLSPVSCYPYNYVPQSTLHRKAKIALLPNLSAAEIFFKGRKTRSACLSTFLLLYNYILFDLKSNILFCSRSTWRRPEQTIKINPYTLVPLRGRTS